ncbi:UPF0481 protein At3g47200-like [Lotus japonicus]|nr:UPF0481 protein At3g47200-like [Lotus japonicus]
MPSSASTGYTAEHETEPQIEHIIDISKDIGPAMHDLCCIYKVPSNLRKVNDGEAYEPHLISIGPLHHNMPKLESMHKQKQRYFLSFWGRVTNKKSLENYKDFLKENTDTIRHYYSELDNNSPINENEFVDMILLDSVFILELFLRNSDQSERKKDYMFTTSWIFKGIQRDLLLLENQLPMFLLEALHRKVYNGNCQSFVELAVNYFEDYIPQSSTNDQIKEVMINNFCHFTDLIRSFYLPKEVQEKGWEPSKHFTPENKRILKTATRLFEAGVTFEVVHNRAMLEIKFKRIQVLNWFLCLGCIPGFKFFQCRLQMPQFKATQTTECVLRNLIALEQCHYSDQPFICSYVSLIDSLVNSNQDVSLLVDKEIIVHELGSNQELAEMTNGLCKNVVVTNNYYGKISRKLNDHYYCKWKRYMGMLTSVYFRDPWRISSTAVGIVFFVFAIMNFLRLVDLYKPKHH